jgi:diacylglycerol kinase (ATP)
MAQDLSTQDSTETLEQRKALHREMAWTVASNLFVSFRYAWSGLAYAFSTQRNFRIHVIVGSVAIALSIYLHLSSVEIAIMGLTIGAVLMMELINTALESVVDLTVQQTYHELAKIAKDCAAGAVLISAIVSILVASVLLIPPLLEKAHLVLPSSIE